MLQIISRYLYGYEEAYKFGQLFVKDKVPAYSVLMDIQLNGNNKNKRLWKE